MMPWSIEQNQSRHSQPQARARVIQVSTEMPARAATAKVTRMIGS